MATPDDRTLPTSPGGIVGLSPIDAYVNDRKPAGYFETNLVGLLNVAMTTVRVVTNCNIKSGGIVQGLNVTVTLGSSSTYGTTACGAYILLDAGTADRSVNGRMSVLEARLDIGASTAALCCLSVLCLDFDNESTASIMNSAYASYICLRERSSVQKMPNIFDFKDISSAGSIDSDLFATKSVASVSHTLRMMVGSTPYWIMVSDAR